MRERAVVNLEMYCAWFFGSNLFGNQVKKKIKVQRSFETFVKTLVQTPASLAPVFLW